MKSAWIRFGGPVNSDAGTVKPRGSHGQRLLTVAIRLYSLKRSANFSIEPESLC